MAILHGEQDAVVPWREAAGFSGCYDAYFLLLQDSGYPYLPAFVSLLEHPNSHIRNRTLELIAANAKWDSQGLYDTSIHQFLLHIKDKTPATARKCIQLLPKIAIAKPELVPQIHSALQDIDLSLYSERAQQSIKKAVSTALAAIELVK